MVGIVSDCILTVKTSLSNDKKKVIIMIIKKNAIKRQKKSRIRSKCSLERATSTS